MQSGPFSPHQDGAASELHKGTLAGTASGSTLDFQDDLGVWIMGPKSIAYPLVNVYITMENHHFEWENSL